MRKLIVSAAGAALLVSGVGSSALAGPGDGYPGTIRTSTNVSGPGQARVGQTATYTASLEVASDGSPCKGEFDLTVTKGNAVVQEGSKTTNGGSKSFDVT